MCFKKLGRLNFMKNILKVNQPTRPTSVFPAYMKQKRTNNLNFSCKQSYNNNIFKAKNFVIEHLSAISWQCCLNTCDDNNFTPTQNEQLECLLDRLRFRCFSAATSVKRLMSKSGFLPGDWLKLAEQPTWLSTAWIRQIYSKMSN